ncbi:MAG: pyruvate dehydrogenase complex dihydrolipoamide acetyltransferase [Phaeodactylibacter sp.]|nr:pyruvate dehydrogenase complex dihydrolipoamide acetyltransferase [Phaeodactylibacter sp.]
MAEVIRMPRMSDTMEEGVIVEWLKGEGDPVEIGETLAEVETDKATMDLDSVAEGVILHIAVKEGAVPIDGIIAIVGKEGEDWKSLLSEDALSSNAADNGSASNSVEPEKETVSAPAQPAAPTGGAASDSRVKASPLARTMAKDLGIELSNVSGSGDQGRIVKRDTEAAAEGRTTTAPQPAAPAAPVAEPTKTAPPAAPAAEKPTVVPFTFAGGDSNYEDVPVSQMRKVIARRLGESKFTAPHFYLTVEINMGKATELRTRLKEIAPTKISFNDLVIKAAAVALRQHPAVNSSWLEDKIRINKEVHMGVAVAVEDGLLVPVVRYADMKTLSQINTEVRELAGRAKSRRLKPEEMSGNTFTISNLGMFGIEEFTAIINPPDACILAVGGIIEKPVVEAGEIRIGQMMKVTLSCDHRVVDGATGAQFLQTLKEILEEPMRLLV